MGIDVQIVLFTFIESPFKMLLYLRLVTIFCAMFLSFHQLFADLTDTLKRYHAENSTDLTVLMEWDSKLRQELVALAPLSSEYFMVKSALAKNFEKRDEPMAAYHLYKEIFDSEACHDNSRFVANYKGLHALSKAGGTVRAIEEGIVSLNIIKDRIKESDSAKYLYGFNDNLDQTMARMVQSAANIEFQFSGKSDQDKLDYSLALESAAQHLDRHIKVDPESQVAAAEIRLLAAQLIFEIAEFEKKALELQSTALSSVELYLKNNSDSAQPMSPIASKCALALAHMQFADDISGYAEYSKALLKGVAANHEVPSLLLKQAMDYANGFIAKGEGDLALVNEVLQLLLDTEKAWYPSAYKNHVNYQWGLLLYARHALSLGQKTLAATLLKEAKSLNLRGEVLQDLYLKLIAEHDQSLVSTPRRVAPVVEETSIAEVVLDKEESTPIPAESESTPSETNRWTLYFVLLPLLFGGLVITKHCLKKAKSIS